jgi:hypothetical protein
VDWAGGNFHDFFVRKRTVCFLKVFFGVFSGFEEMTADNMTKKSRVSGLLCFSARINKNALWCVFMPLQQAPSRAPPLNPTVQGIRTVMRYC